MTPTDVFEVSDDPHYCVMVGCFKCGEKSLHVQAFHSPIYFNMFIDTDTLDISYPCIPSYPCISCEMTGRIEGISSWGDFIYSNSAFGSSPALMWRLHSSPRGMCFSLCTSAAWSDLESLLSVGGIYCIQMQVNWFSR